MKLKKIIKSILGTAAIATALPAMADVQISGFLTAGASYSDNEIPLYRGDITDDQPNYLQDTVLGIQLDSQLDDYTRMSAQLIAKYDSDNFDTNAEWLYIARNVGSFSTFRIGRLRLPLYMNSQNLFVGASYPWIRPPQAVYNLLVGLSGYNGMDVTFNHESDLGNFEFQLFTGKLNDTIPLNFGIPAEASTDQLIGTVLRFGTADLDLHFSYSRMDADIVIDSFVSTGPGPISIVPTEIGSDAEVTTLGAKYTLGSLDLRAEASQRKSDDIGTIDAWYGSMAYTLGDWVPYLVLAQADSDAVPATSIWTVLTATFPGGTNTLLRDSDTITLGVRKNLSPTVSFNAELLSSEAKHGALGQFNSYIPNAAGDELEDPDVNMLSFAINVLF